jgi:hypothetical protein
MLKCVSHDFYPFQFGLTELTDRCRSCVWFGSAQAKRLVNNLLRDAAN